MRTHEQRPRAPGSGAGCETISSEPRVEAVSPVCTGPANTPADNRGMRGQILKERWNGGGSLSRRDRGVRTRGRSSGWTSWTSTPTVSLFSPTPSASTLSRSKTPSTSGSAPRSTSTTISFFLVVHGAKQDGGASRRGPLSSTRQLPRDGPRGSTCPEVDKCATRRTRRRRQGGRADVLYRVIDALVDTFFPVLADSTIDRQPGGRHPLKPTDQQLGELFAMKR